MIRLIQDETGLHWVSSTGQKRETTMAEVYAFASKLMLFVHGSGESLVELAKKGRAA